MESRPLSPRDLGARKFSDFDGLGLLKHFSGHGSVKLV